ncbi:MAG: hypothetical protein A3B99_00515 [Candidatus Yanofskybacteria bacterium RIFCSPHIGHO2_02_FULL_44_12b]|uniref:Uncharacterized protein n=2 Tax=Candidatus Yanofskyibacteriota TaxID=1752733 RepID=A0A1F8GIC9_9BACT|nr:MAG: hypothetical protein UW79_C0008G0023 [Candidatus Yanofskybacteria bacterium GW2011_GWA2_44_9]OGN04840.1 MAG: hypothetical protein A2659_04520 [Candidatus Yanofskybacteria bacterium RIFCSPHIGHO2_01_FULL_44_24]OGN16086.1 MAG: hypothetical protein A3B99_00515 [Candidatus Yanofskybacteria bacterium RIFCSPHIGHO2_02_FULL_44_12b]OGN25157.1 MAG: hypothetical protein A2925_02890 [Candidatus Yanofskybacteria bacterium RIFCSPLOWO2_01_FULL_44_22]
MAATKKHVVSRCQGGLSDNGSPYPWGGYSPSSILGSPTERSEGGLEPIIKARDKTYSKTGSMPVFELGGMVYFGTFW